MALAPVTIMPPGGLVKVSMQIPDVPAIAGVQLWFQALVWHIPSRPSAYRLSNVVTAVIEK